MDDTISKKQRELQSIVDNEVMLTTIDNPFNPFTQYTLWYAFDVQHHYNSCAYLARIVSTSPDLSEVDEALAINIAIDEIIEMNLNGKFIKVSRADFKKKMHTVQHIEMLKD